MSTFRRTTDPKQFPVEVCMLFERASVFPVRCPLEGSCYESERQAFGAKMAFARWRAQMLRSPDCPKAWAATIRTLQFSAPASDADGWHFYIKPMSSNPIIDSIRPVIGDTVPLDEFWSTYTS